MPSSCTTRSMPPLLAWMKVSEPLTSAKEIGNVLRRAFTRLRSGRGGPVLVEIPVDVWNEEIETLDYTVAQLASVGAPVLGTVLNDYDPARDGGAYAGGPRTRHYIERYVPGGEAAV